MQRLLAQWRAAADRAARRAKHACAQISMRMRAVNICEQLKPTSSTSQCHVHGVHGRRLELVIMWGSSTKKLEGFHIVERQQAHQGIAHPWG